MWMGRASFLRRMLQNVVTDSDVSKLKPLEIAWNEGSSLKRCSVKHGQYSYRSYTTSGEKAPDALVEEIDKTAYRLMYVMIEDNDKAKLSSLYMQITEGQCPEAEPTKGSTAEKIYWKNWKDLGSMTKEEAAKQYLETAKKYV